MLSPRQLEAAFHGEKQTQTNSEDHPEAAGSSASMGRQVVLAVLRCSSVLLKRVPRTSHLFILLHLNIHQNTRKIGEPDSLSKLTA